MAELGRAELNAMVAGAIVDAHDEDEQVSGFYDLIEEQSPGPYLELFARRPWAGWDQRGNQIDSTFTFEASHE